MYKVCISAVKVVLLGLLLASTSPVYADEVTDSINEAMKQYKDGEYADAVGSLHYAAQLISQKRGEQLQSFLPKPLAGWKAEDPRLEAVGAAMFGGGVSVERQYHKGSSYINVKIITDSPILQSMMMMLNNPMFATSQGGKLRKIKGQKAVVKYDASDRDGEINIVVVNRFLVTIEGSGVSQKELTDYAARIDYKKLAAFP